jgi:hypothetical protein
VIRKIATLGLILMLNAFSTWPPPSSAHMQRREKRGRFSERAITAADHREHLIKKELTKLGEHEWAGEYYYGDGLGVNVNLTLAPELGYVFTWHGCLGLYDLNYGAVRFENGKVKLVFKYHNHRGGFHGIAPEFYPVRWGDRHYLIPSDGVVEFCNAVNSGLEPCAVFCARFLLLRGDQDKRVEGEPTIPVQFRRYVLSTPITAKIISLERSYIERDRGLPDNFRISQVTLDSGTAEGVLPGMELHSYDPPNSETVEIIEVNEHSSRARIVQIGTDGDKPKAGWRLSTRLIDSALPPK